ncbi:MAG: hypothetical protein R3B59_09840 [Dehalococcoidia bacterium]
MAERYTVSFRVTSDGSEGISLMEAAGQIVRDWARERFIGPPVDTPTGEWRGTSELLRIRQGQIEDAGFFALDWEHPDRDEPLYHWLTEVRLATEGGPVQATVDVRLLDTGPALRLEGKDVDRPVAVSRLIEAFTCDYGGHPLTIRAMRVGGANAETFTKDVILNPDRRLPTVVLTRDADGACGLDPDALQSRLAGLATVALYEDEATWALTKQLGQALTCFGGAVRIYWPGITISDNPLRHRRWLPQHARELGPRLGKVLLHLFVSRFSRYTDQSVYQDIAGRVRRAEQEALMEQLRERSGSDDAYLELLEQVQARVTEAEDDRDRWRQQAQEFERSNEELNALVRQHESNWKMIGTASQGDAEPDDELEVRTVAEAVRLASERFESLRFLPSAIESAAMSPYDRPAQVYEAFEALDELTLERLQGPLGKSIDDWLGERGFPYTPRESQTTMGKWGHERQFRDGQRTRTVQEHIKFGADGDPQHHIRIYVTWDDDESRWIVAYVGRHLTTTQS